MPPRVLWLENCYPVNSRTQRIVDTLVRAKAADIHVCAWDRRSRGTSPASTDINISVLRTPIGYQNLARKLFCLPQWLRFVRSRFAVLSPQAVAASSWDMAAVAALVAPKHIPILYDILDMPSGRGPMLWLARSVERYAIRRSRAVLYASRFFPSQYESAGRATLVLENMPTFVPDIKVTVAQFGSQVRLAYIGNVRYSNTLLPLVDVCARRGFPLDIWGDGPVLPKLQAHVGQNPNIRFHGRYTYERLPAILENVDVVWAAYPADDFNVRFAISNKFFESIAFLRPSVFSRNTALGDYVAEQGIGFCLDATSIFEVDRFVASLQRGELTLDHVRTKLAAYRAANETRLRWKDIEKELLDFAHYEWLANV